MMICRTDNEVSEYEIQALVDGEFSETDRMAVMTRVLSSPTALKTLSAYLEQKDMVRAWWRWNTASRQ